MNLEDDRTSDFERSFYDDTDLPSKNQVLENLLDEISQSLQSLTEVSQEIKKNIVDDLHKLKINEEYLTDFQLNTMELLWSLSKDTTIEVFLKTSFKGCIDAMRCSEIIGKSSPDKQVSTTAYSLMRRFEQTTKIMAHLLKVMGFSPDVRDERVRFETEIEPRLLPNTETYLNEKDYRRLISHKEVIQNFQIIKELQNAVYSLRRVLEEQRHRLANLVPERTEEHILFAEDTMVTSNEESLPDQELILWVSCV